MAPKSSRDGRTVGIVGDVPESVRGALATADGESVAGGSRDVLRADPEWIVAVGEQSLLELVRAGVDRPVLPIAAGPGVASVPRADAADAVESVLGGDAERTDRRLLSVRFEDETATALFDVSLVAAEPARISEYSVQTDGRRVARFRADGVVVATPAGSYGYADDAGGAIVQPGTDVGVVVPVAPFVTDADHWILRLDDVSIDVEREGPVALVVDDREWRTVAPGETVHLGTDGHLPVFRVPSSRRFAGSATGLEKH